MTELLSDTENVFRVKGAAGPDPNWIATVLWATVWWGARATGQPIEAVRSYGKKYDRWVATLVDYTKCEAQKSGAQLVTASDRASVELTNPDGSEFVIEHVFVGNDKHAAERRLLDDLQDRFPEGHVGAMKFVVTGGDHEVVEFVDQAAEPGAFWVVIPPNQGHVIRHWFFPTDGPRQGFRRFERVLPSQVVAINSIVHEYKIAQKAYASPVLARLARRASERATLGDEQEPFVRNLAKQLTRVSALDWGALSTTKVTDGAWIELWPSRQFARDVLRIVSKPRFIAIADPQAERAQRLAAGTGSKQDARYFYGAAALMTLASRYPVLDQARLLHLAIKSDPAFAALHTSFKIAGALMREGGSIFGFTNTRPAETVWQPDPEPDSY